ncbi:MAG: DUF4190 domain-containing protein [Ruminococcus sp.]|nr:DUF4190 domain-containing protein [Ruminococcus sp.]
MEYDNNNYNQQGYNNSAPQQNYYQQPYNYYGAYPPPQQTNPLGIVSMVLGIVSLVLALAFSCCVPGVNLPFSIAAIVLGVLQIKSKKNQNGRGLGIAGLVCGIISTVISVIALLFYLGVFAIGIADSVATSNTYY